MPGLLAKISLSAAILAIPKADSASHPNVPEPSVPIRALGDRAFAADMSGFLVSGPERPRLIERWWAGLMNWAAEQLDRTGSDSVHTLPTEASRLDPELRMAAIPLGGGAVLISASREGHGTAFVLAPQGGRMRTLWTITAPDAAERRSFPSLASWSPNATIGEGCDGTPCSAISVDAVGALPPGPNGASRFYLQGTYFSEMGATKGGQLGIWQWDGRRARPLLVRDFAFMVDQSAPVLTVRGAELILQVKGSFRHFYACGSCEGRQMIWRFRVEPGGVRDLGRTSLTPELDFMDGLAGRLLRNEPVSDLSEAAAAAFFARQVRAAAEQIGPARPGETPLVGMLGYWQVTRVGNVRRLCFNSDGVNGVFTLTRRAGRMRLLAARETGDDACNRPGAHL